MPNISQGNKEEVARFSEEKLNKFFQNSITDRKEELDKVKEESKKNKIENKKILEKHFFDITTQSLCQFTKIGAKKHGETSGFKAEHKYSEKHKAIYMIKYVTIYDDMYKYNKYISAQINVSGFINEYIGGSIYKFFLYNRAPIVELIDDLQREMSEKSYGINQVKVDKKLCLRSKFLDNFITIQDLKGILDIEGFEKILAVAILLGEHDLVNTGNLGFITNEYENAKGEKIQKKSWAKIDHGYSFFRISTKSDADSFLDNYLQIDLAKLHTLHIKVNTEELLKELLYLVDYYYKHKEVLHTLIEKKVEILSNILAYTTDTIKIFHIDEKKNRLYSKFVYLDKSFKQCYEKVPIQNNDLRSYFKCLLNQQVALVSNIINILPNKVEPWKEKRAKVISDIISNAEVKAEVTDVNIKKLKTSNIISPPNLQM